MVTEMEKKKKKDYFLVSNDWESPKEDCVCASDILYLEWTEIISMYTL